MAYGLCEDHSLWSIGHRIDYFWNSIAESTVHFFLITLNFIFKSFIEILHIPPSSENPKKFLFFLIESGQYIFRFVDFSWPENQLKNWFLARNRVKVHKLSLWGLSFRLYNISIIILNDPKFLKRKVYLNLKNKESINFAFFS